MSGTTKKVNYTPEMVTNIVTVYTAAQTEAERDAALETLAESHGKTVNSIRAKLSMEKVYIAKVKPAKKAGAEKKENIIADIAENANQVDGFFDSLSNVNKTVLEFIRKLQVTVESLTDTLDAYKVEFGDLPEDDETAS